VLQRGWKARVRAIRRERASEHERQGASHRWLLQAGRRRLHRRASVAAPWSATIRLVGRNPVAGAAIKDVPVGGSRALTLRLSQRARTALAHHVLDLTTALTQPGHPAVSRSVVAVLEHAVLGHARPDSVVRHVVRNASTRRARGAAGSTITTVTFEWKWDIPVRTYLVLQEFRCPADTPYVAASKDQILSLGKFRGLKAMLDAKAKTGTGYGLQSAEH
jgi:hypothetical protein